MNHLFFVIFRCIDGFRCPSVLSLSSVESRWSRQLPVLHKMMANNVTITESIQPMATTVPRPQTQESNTLLITPDIIRTYHVLENFDPPPILSNQHVQTMGGYFLRNVCPYIPFHLGHGNHDGNILSYVIWRLFFQQQRMKQSRRDGRKKNSNMIRTMQQDSLWQYRETIETPDGDFFHVDSIWFKNHRSSSIVPSTDQENVDVDTIIAQLTAETTVSTVLLVHGLESNSQSSLSQEMALSYVQRGFNCICLNFRGCSGVPNRTLGGYHLGFTDDLLQYLNIYQRRRFDARKGTGRIYLAGFSLGANVVLKCVGDLGPRAFAEYGIAGVIALSAPLDQEKNAQILGQPGGIRRYVYTNNLLAKLKTKARESLCRFANNDPNTKLFHYKAIEHAKTIADFDDAFIAPVYGFSSANDYYRKTSSIHVLPQITVPTLILNSADDPFLDPTVWPPNIAAVDRHEEVGESLLNNDLDYDFNESNTKWIRTEHGGHLGFCWHRTNDPTLLSDFELNGSLYYPPSWSSNESSRFLKHIDNSL
jgi:uncharacterized protein